MVHLTAVVFLLQSAVALAGNLTPTTDELTDALSRPRLDWCDALVCTYRLGRQYVARDVKCDLLSAGTVVCAYERTAFDFAWLRPLRRGEAIPPDTRKWEAAKTELKRLGGR